MAREIKFRAWEKLGKKMIIPPNRSEREFVAWCVYIQPDENYEIMQYSGLKDKHGTEIYEGDILYVAGSGNFEVSFHYGKFGFYGTSGIFIGLDEDYEGDVERVIGNKYENEGLLNG